ncbi:TPA: hypothetical protein K8N54_003142 [Serratia marcescens]|uniref:hypothetical protein n=1 Tax=Serratia marcescens TaxID=615 RepID=UPI001C78D68E|nr:hypothetical protein [Serratia marcescens]BCZ42643.1 hypothetical protein SMGES_39690 [Serratia marcescens]HBI6269644.1 hypothetical protein [Serratia marcescens]HBI6950017.1 hypothetical protein [Serratia marcescens]HBI6958828.1 hypothetical protein [Serratia marcescens]
MQILKGAIIIRSRHDSPQSDNDKIKQLEKEVEDCCKFDAKDWSNPLWTENNKVHCWRNYAPKQLRDIWHTFSDKQKKHIAFTLQTIADNEQWD